MHRAHRFGHAVGQRDRVYCKRMNIRPDFAFRFTKNLPDLAQHGIGVGAVVERFRLGCYFKPDQRRICGPQDRWPQIGGCVVQQQNHICRAPCSLQPQRRADCTVALIGQQQKTKPLRDGQCQQQHGQQLAPQGLRKQTAQGGKIQFHCISLTSAAKL